MAKKETTKTKATEADTATKTQKLPTYFYALGRRKTATATVRLFKGSGDSLINEKSAVEVYAKDYDQSVLAEPFVVAGLDPEKFYYTVKVSGSGHKGQLEAIRHAISRAIVVMDEDLKSPLKKAGLMTRDPRMVERKKPGLRKARRAEQFSKR